MKDKALKRYSRLELADKLVQVLEENARLKEELEEVKKQLETQRLLYEKQGSLAEAALALSGIFEAADQAAKIYLDNLEQYKAPGENGGNLYEETGTAGNQSGECQEGAAPASVPQAVS